MRLRLATPADGPACSAIYAPYVTDTCISFELTPPDGVEVGRRIAGTVGRLPWVVAEVDGVVRGYAYAGHFRDRAAYAWTAETTVYVDRDFHGRGLGRATLRAVILILRFQGFHSAVAGVTPPNPASVGLHEALGYRRIGLLEEVGWKDGRWHGVEFFALELSPSEQAPAPIRLLNGITGSNDLVRVMADALT